MDLYRKIDAMNRFVAEAKKDRYDFVHISFYEDFLADLEKHIADAKYENDLDAYSRYGKDRATEVAHYTNLIITAGYAGFFGLWSMSKDYIDPSQARITFILIAISLFIFVMHEVIDVAFSGFNIEFGSKALLKAKEQDILAYKINWAKKARSYDGYRALWYYQFWPYSFAACVVFGVIAYLILLYVIFINL